MVNDENNVVKLRISLSFFMNTFFLWVC